jgi:hypothetical protein
MDRILNLSNNIAITSKALGRGNISIPTNIRGFFINAVGECYSFVGTNGKGSKIIIAGREFFLTGSNGTTTNTLVFTYTVKINDKIDTKY